MKNLVDKDKEAEEKYILHIRGETFKEPKVVRSIFLWKGCVCGILERVSNPR